MNSEFNSWLKENTAFPGVLACGLRYPDKTTFSHSYAAEFATDKLEPAWRTAVEAFQTSKQSKQSFSRLRWVFDKALFHCAVRGDGVCLGIFTSKGTQEPSAESVDRLFAEFQAFRA